MLLNINFIPILFVIVIADDLKPASKCCDVGSVLNESFECTKRSKEVTSSQTRSESSVYMINGNEKGYTACFKNGEAGKRVTRESAQDGNNNTCVDTLMNGTRVELFCESKAVVSNDTSEQCDSLFTQMNFWGAGMVVFATIIYNIPFIIVVIIYCSLPELRYRAYDRAVISYYMSYMIINFLLIILGSCTLCHVTISVTIYRLFGLSLMFWTQGAVVWLFIICFDMTLVITRFRWAPKGGSARGQEERRKGLIYAAWGWGFAAVLTLLAAIVELTPMFPEDSPIRPNFHHFRGANMAVIIWVITGPVLVCLVNTCLFIYTTIKTIAVQKSTAIIHENRKANVKKKYSVFLKLYLLMDTPWFTSALGAIYPDLWILKFIKMFQPILIIILLVPRKRILEAAHCCNAEDEECEASPMNKEALNNRRTT